MKKIKYGNRRIEAEPSQLQNLKQNDEICEAVLDTLNDDYLTYITHLVKHSKTPMKNRLTRDREQPSSDSQAFEKPNQQQPTNIQPHLPSRRESTRARHHSETAPKRNQPHPQQPKPYPRNQNHHDHTLLGKLSPHKDKETTVLRQKTIGDKRRKKKGDYRIDDSFFKNQQKTMSFTRNYYNPYQEKLKHSQQKEKDFCFKPKAKPKYYTNYQEYSQTSQQKVTINDNMPQNQESLRQSVSYPFINDIDNYLLHLEGRPQTKKTTNIANTRSRDKPEKQLGFQKKKKWKDIEEDYGEQEIQQILKDNLKLNKKVKGYQQKIEELEDQVSSHLIQCKQRDKHYKNKIGQLVKALTQAASKINSQKTQISTMKQLLRVFGQQVKQIQNESEDSDCLEQDISESIIRYMGPQKHSSEVRTKYKRGLESTLPKHEEEKRFWRQ